MKYTTKTQIVDKNLVNNIFPSEIDFIYIFDDYSLPCINEIENNYLYVDRYDNNEPGDLNLYELQIKNMNYSLRYIPNWPENLFNDFIIMG